MQFFPTAWAGEAVRAATEPVLGQLRNTQEAESGSLAKLDRWPLSEKGPLLLQGHQELQTEEKQQERTRRTMVARACSARSTVTSPTLKVNSRNRHKGPGFVAEAQALQ